MKLIKSILTIATALAATVGYAGDSAPFRLDTTKGTRVAKAVETIAYSTEWEKGEKVIVAADGVMLKEAVAPASGDVTWNAATASGGNHALTHTTYKNGVAVKVETINFLVNWCTVTFDANGGTGGWSKKQDRGSAIVAPTVTREWCNFAGWTPSVAATVPANDVTYTAQWQRWGDSISASKIGGKTMKQLYPSDYARMTTVVLEEGITGLPAGFFNGCNNVVNLTLPSSLREFGIDDLPSKIKASLAYDANGFKIYGNWILDYKNRSASSVTIPEGIVGIGRGAFAAMYDLETVTMPESLKYIANGAFEDCSWIQELQFKSGLRYVGAAAFKGCSSLLRATFADGVEHVRESAFEDCWQMQSVRLPFTVKNIGYKAFSGCGNIRGVTVPTHLTTMQRLFPASYDKIETAEVAEGETTVMDDMFAGCVALRGGATQTDMSMIPNTVTNIGARAFQGCSSLTAFVVPDSVVKIGVSVFQGCTALWNVTLSRNLTAIPDYAFYGCSMLETMVVPEKVAYLGNRFFSGRTDPKPDGVIENALYYLCANAPDCHANAYSAISGNMTTYALQESRSWDGRQGSRVLPPSWNGYAITYWTPNRFDVTFNANGGQFDPSGGSTWSEQQITDTPYVLPSTEPARPGWAFEGWWTEQTGGAEVRYTTTVTATRTHTLYAHWRSLGERMTVKFNSNGGTVVVPESQDYVPGQTFAQFPVPTRLGYHFLGWYITKDAGEWVTTATILRGNATWYAQWSASSAGWDVVAPVLAYPVTNGTSGTSYTIQFDAQGGALASAYRTKTVRWGEEFVALPVPTYGGYLFAGWDTRPWLDGRITEATAVPAANMELFARWFPITYRVRFHANGGRENDVDQIFTYDVRQALATHVFTREGFAFTGWATTPSGQVRYAENASVVNLEEVQGHIVDLYAVWSGVGYSVRFDSNGGTGIMDNQTIRVGETQHLWPCTFARAGYVFAGWALSPTDAAAKKIAYLDGEAVRNLATANGATVPLYAVWMAPGDTVRISFDANGGSVAPDYWDCVAGAAVEAFPLPTRPGFTFAGWFTAANGGMQVASIASVTSAQTFYAHWTPNGGADPGDSSYVVTFNPNGGSVTETTRMVSGGASVGAMPVPVRSGYSFAGWFTAATDGVQVYATTVVRASVTYYAHWTENGGGTLTPDPVTPDPVKPDPVTPDPVTPDPVKPDPVKPDPVTPVVSTFTVTFNANGGNVSPTSRKVNAGKTVGTLPTPTREGYTFDGWFTAMASGTKIGTETKVTGNVTYYAHWTEIIVNYGGVVENVAFSKAQTALGALYDAKGNLVGTVELKFGKINARKQTVKIAATATLIVDGKAKKVGAKAINPTLSGGRLGDTLAFKAPVGNMAFSMDADGVFTLKNGSYEMVGMRTRQGAVLTVAVGGKLAKDRMSFNVALDSVPNFGKDGVLLGDALPDGEPVLVAGGTKWSFRKSPSLKYKKDRATGVYELIGLDDASKPNISGLKLSYTAKTGIFKGSFKMYATNEATTPAGKSPKLKKYTVNVIGFVVDGKGEGQAVLKKPAGTWSVTVE